MRLEIRVDALVYQVTANGGFDLNGCQGEG